MEHTGGRDHISSLLDDILCHILSFLPMKSAVQSSVLSRRWRHLWKFNPVIDFENLWDCDDLEDYSFISRCLSLHRATKLRRFVICGGGTQGFYPEVELWVAFAAARDVQELLLFNCMCFEVPLSLYAAKSLYNLSLIGVLFSYQPSFKFNSFALLKDIYIGYSRLCDEVVVAIVFSCPLLENFTLISCSQLNKVKIAAPNLRLKHLVFAETELFELEIDAPNLVLFKYEGCVVPFFLKNLTSLAEVHLKYIVFHLGSDFGYVKTLMNQLSHVKVLCVSSWFAEFIANAYYAVGNRCSAFQNLKTFCWSGPLDYEGSPISMAAFLGDCSSLEFIKLNFNNWWLRPTLHDRKLNINVGCLFGVQKIEVAGYDGSKYQYQLMKLLLEKAVVLDTFTVIFDDEIAEIHIKRMEEEFCVFPRASSKAQLQFHKKVIYA